MRVLVTVADGVIGSHLVESLLAAGHDVTAFCQYNSRGDKGWLAADCRTVFGDVRDLTSLGVAAEDQEVIFHLAALIGIPYSYTAPLSYIETNSTGTYNAIVAATRFRSRLIITSTSEVYGSCQIAPMSETHPLNAQSPYAATKIAADQLALSFHRSFGTPVTIVRPFNTYGPRQSLRAVIPNIICQFLDGPEVHLGNVAALRDYTHVADTCAGFIAAMEHGAAGEVYNLGNGCAWRIDKIAQLCAGIIGRDMVLTHDGARDRPAASEVDRLICDNTRAANELKWTPKITMPEGLMSTIDWFRDNRGKYAAGGYAV